LSPTVFKEGPFRFFFFSREYTFSCPDNEAKFWIEPIISLATYRGLNKKELNQMQLLVEKRIDEIRSAWEKHFPS